MLKKSPQCPSLYSVADAASVPAQSMLPITQDSRGCTRKQHPEYRLSKAFQQGLAYP